MTFDNNISSYISSIFSSNAPGGFKDGNNIKFKYVNFGQKYAYGKLIAPFKYLDQGAHEGCMFPIFTVGDGLNTNLGISLIYLENYTVGGQNNKITNCVSDVTWAFNGTTDDGRPKLIITGTGYGWTFFIPWVMWTSGPNWEQYYDLDFEIYE